VPRKFFRKYLPHADTVRSSRLAGLFGRSLQDPNLWHLNRRSVAGGVAIGLFCGLIPGPVQMLFALLLAIPLRKNIPVALITTLYTNPITIVPLYLIAYEYGQLLLGVTVKGRVALEPFTWDWWDIGGSVRGFAAWSLGLGKPLAVGLAALAITLAAVGYVGVKLAWRVHVVWQWRARARRRRR
jgi:uncharacterized protein (DUF2062 family)